MFYKSREEVPVNLHAIPSEGWSPVASKEALDLDLDQRHRVYGLFEDEHGFQIVKIPSLYYFDKYKEGLSLVWKHANPTLKVIRK